MWLFAVLVVLAMGVVAMVAAGRGAPMSEAYDDRVDATVPAAGPVSADDLRRVRFPLAFRGYRMQEVDALLDRLAAEREAAPTVVPDGAAGPISEPSSESAGESAGEWAPPPVDGPPPPA